MPPLPRSIAIDDPIFIHHFANWVKVPLADAIAYAGAAPKLYPWSDIVQRLVTWIVPLLVLIGSFQLGPLGAIENCYILSHTLADPHDTIGNLLTWLFARQTIYNHVRRSDVADEVQAALTIVLCSFHLWELSFGRIIHQGQHHTGMFRSTDAILQRFKPLMTLLSRETEPALRARCVKEVKYAAKRLADSMVDGQVKILIGIGNYVVTTIFAYLHVLAGVFTNRTGHSIAFGMLFIWIIVAVSLSCFVGNSKSKYSIGEILEELEVNIMRIMKEELRRTKKRKTGQRRCEKYLSCRETETDTSIFDFHQLNDTAMRQAERSPRWVGVNPSITPSPLCQGKQRILLTALAFLPITTATMAACWMSVTNPTEGFGCRSVAEICFWVAWLLSRVLTEVIRRVCRSETQLRWIRIKDATFFTVLTTCFLSIFFGWFNSPFCFSAWFSLRDLAYILVAPAEYIMHLAHTTWPVILFPLIGLQLVFVGIAYYWFKDGVWVYSIDDEERERWGQGPSFAQSVENRVWPFSSVSNKLRSISLKMRAKKRLRSRNYKMLRSRNSMLGMMDTSLSPSRKQGKGDGGQESDFEYELSHIEFVDCDTSSTDRFQQQTSSTDDWVARGNWPLGVGRSDGAATKPPFHRVNSRIQ